MTATMTAKTAAKPNTLSQTLKKSRWAFLLIGAFSFFLNLLMLVSPIYMMQVFDRVLSSGRIETLIYLTIIAGFALVVYGALEIIRMRILSRIGAWFEDRLTKHTLVATVTAAGQGSDLGAQGFRDLTKVQSFIGSPVVTSFFDLPWVPIFIATIWLMHPHLGMLALGSAVVLFALGLIHERATNNAFKEAATAQGGVGQTINSATRSADSIIAMGMMPTLVSRVRAGQGVQHSEQLKASDRSNAFVGSTKSIRQFVQVAILGLGAALVLGGELTSGGMIAASILLGRALAPAEQAINAWRNFVGARQSYDRLGKILSACPLPKRNTELPAPVGHLELENVTVRLGEAAKPVLQNISFKLAAGEILGIVGPSASGKSTLCRAIVGAVRTPIGSIRLDGAELRKWNPEELGQHVGYLPQDVQLFDGTVRENIARLKEADAETVIAAAQVANAHDMVLRMDDAYETQIGTSGMNLSAGQRQRIGLARAIFGGPKLIVLDEPNANLDQQGEFALFNALKNLKAAGVTTIVVTHRPGLLKHTDRILVLNDGTVSRYGQTDQVLAELAEGRRMRAVE